MVHPQALVEPMGFHSGQIRKKTKNERDEIFEP
jgi:hypothetical protein